MRGEIPVRLCSQIWVWETNMVKQGIQVEGTEKTDRKHGGRPTAGARIRFPLARESSCSAEQVKGQRVIPDSGTGKAGSDPDSRRGRVGSGLRTGRAGSGPGLQDRKAGSGRTPGQEEQTPDSGEEERARAGLRTGRAGRTLQKPEQRPVGNTSTAPAVAGVSAGAALPSSTTGRATDLRGATLPARRLGLRPTSRQAPRRLELHQTWPCCSWKSLLQERL